MSTVVHHIYSNCTQKLAQRLGDNLFGPPARPFQRRLVIGPSQAMKEYLVHFFASHPDYQVFAGVRILPLADAFLELLACLSSYEKGDGIQLQNRIPSLLELSLRIEERIVQALHDIKKLGEEDRISFEPLLGYLGREQHMAMGSDSYKRIGALSVQLSFLFARYGLHGAEFLSDWLEIRGWQQWIWRQVYSEQGAWVYPVRAFDRFCDQLRRNPAQLGFLQGGIHLFGFSSMPKVYLELFSRLKATFYLVSPCLLFWEDVVTDKERIGLRRYLEKREVKQSDLDLWEGFLRDTHPLLANWGKVGRDFAKLLADSDAVTSEEYVDPLKNTLLGSVQSDLLHLQDPRQRKKGEVFDGSIQLHSAVSLLREVEVLYEQLCAMMTEKVDSSSSPQSQEFLRLDTSLAPKEVLVLAPDLDLYAPFIQAVFGSSDSVLAYSLEGVCNRVAKEGFEAVLHLLSIPSLQFSADALLQLFSFSSFLQKWEFSRDDAALVQRWVKQADLRLDLGEDWSGIDRLLLGSVMKVDEELIGKVESDLWPCSSVDATDLPLLGKLIELIHSLKEQLKPIWSGQKKSVQGWLDYLHALIPNYFKMEEGQEAILIEIAKLRSYFPSEEGDLLSVATLVRAVEALADRQFATLSVHNAQKVAFRPLASGNITSAQVIWILGMDEGSFPRSEPATSLCAMRQHQAAKAIPKKGDEDRYLFLEALFLAKKCLVFSYQRVDPQDNKEQSPSLLIQELLDHYVPSHLVSFHHPALAFDSRYFSENPLIKSFSQKNYRNASSYYGKRRELVPFIAEPCIGPEQLKVVEIKALCDLAKDPIRFYFQRVLRMYMRSEEDENKDFILSPLSRSLLRKKAAKRSIQEFAGIWKAEGKLPVGVFGDAAIHALEEEVGDFRDHLRDFQVDSSQIVSVELSALCPRPFLQSEDRWILPALAVPMVDGSIVHLEGVIEQLTPCGILFHGEDKLRDWVKLWPQLLVLGCLKDLPFECPRRVLLTKSGKVREGQFSDWTGLIQAYLVYYYQSLQEIPLLVPDWVPSLVAQSPAELEKAMDQSLNRPSIENPYLQWLKRRKGLPDAEEIFDKWSARARKLYRPMLEAWSEEVLDETV